MHYSLLQCSAVQCSLLQCSAVPYLHPLLEHMRRKVGRLARQVTLAWLVPGGGGGGGGGGPGS